MANSLTNHGASSSGRLTKSDELVEILQVHLGTRFSVVGLSHQGGRRCLPMFEVASVF